MATAMNTRPGGRAPAMAPADRRAAIIAATTQLLLTSGAEVTTRQIAEAACVAEGTIFRVFADKDELIAATVEAAVDPSATEAALAELDLGRPLAAVLIDAVAILQRRGQRAWQLLSIVNAR